METHPLTVLRGWFSGGLHCPARARFPCVHLFHLQPVGIRCGAVSFSRSTEYSFIAICRQREQALTLARSARVRVCVGKDRARGPKPSEFRSPATRMGGHSVEGKDQLPDALRPRYPSGNALHLGIAVWSRGSRAVRVLSGGDGREPEGRSQFPAPEYG